MTDTRTEIRLEAPAALTFCEAETGSEAKTGGAEERHSERAACLLQTGDYPDKGLRLTEDDLDGIAARFSEGMGAGAGAVPVKVEHVDSPLDPLGHVRRVWREGGALLGTLAFPDDLAAFLRRRGAAKLSVGLTREPLALREVSLVLKPRVAGAVLMGAEPDPAVFGPNPGASAEQPHPTDPSLLGKAEEKETEVVRLHAEIARRDAQLLARDVDAQVAAFKAQGRIVPASEAPARALLAAAGEASLTLSEGPEPIARVFRRFLEAQPPVVSFGEAAAPWGEAECVFTQDEHTFLSKRLGVDPARVAALVREERERQTREKKGDGHAR